MKKILMLVLVLMSISGCSISQKDVDSNLGSMEDPSFGKGVGISGYVKIESNIVIDNNIAEFELLVNANVKDGYSRMSVMVDKIRVPFVINGGEVVDYFDIEGDGEDNILKFEVDLSGIVTSKDSIVTITRVAMPHDPNFKVSNNYYFTGAVMEIPFEHINSSGIKDDLVLESRPLEDFDPELYITLEKKWQEFLELSPDPEGQYMYSGILGDGKVIESETKITGRPEVIFYNWKDESYDVVLHILKDGLYLNKEETRGYKFSLKSKEAVKIDLSKYDFDDNRITFHLFLNGLLDSFGPPFIIGK